MLLALQSYFSNKTHSFQNRQQPKIREDKQNIMVRLKKYHKENIYSVLNSITYMVNNVVHMIYHCFHSVPAQSQEVHKVQK